MSLLTFTQQQKATEGIMSLGFSTQQQRAIQTSQLLTFYSAVYSGQGRYFHTPRGTGRNQVLRVLCIKCQKRGQGKHLCPMGPVSSTPKFNTFLVVQEATSITVSENNRDPVSLSQCQKTKKTRRVPIRAQKTKLSLEQHTAHKSRVPGTG